MTNFLTHNLPINRTFPNFESHPRKSNLTVKYYLFLNFKIHQFTIFGNFKIHQFIIFGNFKIRQFTIFVNLKLRQYTIFRNVFILEYYIFFIFAIFLIKFIYFVLPVVIMVAQVLGLQLESHLPNAYIQKLFENYAVEGVDEGVVDEDEYVVEVDENYYYYYYYCCYILQLSLVPWILHLIVWKENRDLLNFWTI